MIPAPAFALSYTALPGAFGRERAVVRRFSDRSAMHNFLNSQRGNKWREHAGANGVPLAGGTYAMAGGAWRNVRCMDRALLAHI